MAVAWLTGCERALETGDLKVRAILTTCEHAIYREGDVLKSRKRRFSKKQGYIVGRNGPIGWPRGQDWRYRGRTAGGTEDRGRSAFTMVAY